MCELLKVSARYYNPQKILHPWCRIICMLRQQILPKSWFAHVNMTSYCDVTNSAYPGTMTTTRHCSLLKFGKRHTTKLSPWASPVLCTPLPINDFIHKTVILLMLSEYCDRTFALCEVISNRSITRFQVLGWQNIFLGGKIFVFIMCLKEIFLGPTKFWREQKFGGTGPKYTPVAMSLVSTVDSFLCS